MSTITITPEVGDLKARLKDTWMAGDYDRFSRYMEQGARMFYERLDLPAGRAAGRRTHRHGGALKSALSAS